MSNKKLTQAQLKQIIREELMTISEIDNAKLPEKDRVYQTSKRNPSRFDVGRMNNFSEKEGTKIGPHPYGKKYGRDPESAKSDQSRGMNAAKKTALAAQWDGPGISDDDRLSQLHREKVRVGAAGIDAAAKKAKPAGSFGDTVNKLQKNYGTDKEATPAQIAKGDAAKAADVAKTSTLAGHAAAGKTGGGDIESPEGGAFPSKAGMDYLQNLDEDETKEKKSDEEGEPMPSTIRRLPSPYAPKKKAAPMPNPEPRKPEGAEAKPKREPEGAGKKRKGSWIDQAKSRQKKNESKKKITQAQLRRVIQEELKAVSEAWGREPDSGGYGDVWTDPHGGARYPRSYKGGKMQAVPRIGGWDDPEKYVTPPEAGLSDEFIQQAYEKSMERIRPMERKYTGRWADETLSQLDIDKAFKKFMFNEVPYSLQDKTPLNGWSTHQVCPGYSEGCESLYSDSEKIDIRIQQAEGALKARGKEQEKADQLGWDMDKWDAVTQREEEREREGSLQEGKRARLRKEGMFDWFKKKEEPTPEPEQEQEPAFEMPPLTSRGQEIMEKWTQGGLSPAEAHAQYQGFLEGLYHAGSRGQEDGMGWIGERIKERNQWNIIEKDYQKGYQYDLDYGTPENKAWKNGNDYIRAEVVNGRKAAIGVGSRGMPKIDQPQFDWELNRPGDPHRTMQEQQRKNEEWSSFKADQKLFENWRKFTGTKK